MKSCATNAYFNGLMFCAALLGAAFAGVTYAPLVSLVAIPGTYIVAASARIVLHKFATANRIFGFELHISRTRQTTDTKIPDNLRTGLSPGEFLTWQPWMANISWEEALRAWRCVQPTCFSHCYNAPKEEGNRSNPEGDLESKSESPGGRTKTSGERGYRWWRKVKSELKRELPNHYTPRSEVRGEYPWWDAKYLAGQLEAPQESDTAVPQVKGVYHAGGYLQQVLLILQRVSWTFLALLGFGAAASGYRAAVLLTECKYWFQPVVWGALCVFLLATCYWRFVKVRRVAHEMDRRRKILENGLLSIDSCAIIWQAVVLAHFRSLDGFGNTRKGYTQRLARQGVDLAQNLSELHDWVESKTLLTKSCAPSPS